MSISAASSVRIGGFHRSAMARRISDLITKSYPVIGRCDIGLTLGRLVIVIRSVELGRASTDEQARIAVDMATVARSELLRGGWWIRRLASSATVCVFESAEALPGCTIRRSAECVVLSTAALGRHPSLPGRRRAGAASTVR